MCARCSRAGKLRIRSAEGSGRHGRLQLRGSALPRRCRGAGASPPASRRCPNRPGCRPISTAPRAIWEIYSTPSRDARLKTAFKELRDQAEPLRRRCTGPATPSSSITAMIWSATCCASMTARRRAAQIAYTRSDGSTVRFGYEEARRRLFRMSFDPYQCVEHRWGADTTGANFDLPRRCRQARLVCGRTASAQSDSTAPMRRGWTSRCDELRTPGPGKGVAAPPDIDVRALSAQAADAARRQRQAGRRPAACAKRKRKGRRELRRPSVEFHAALATSSARRPTRDRRPQLPSAP